MMMFDWLARQAEYQPDKTALVDLATQREFSYAQFHLRASHLAEFLTTGWGLQPGDRLAILAPNSSEYFEILWACAKSGVILVCLNWRLALPELTYIIRDSTPTALIYDPSLAETAQPLAEKAGISRIMALSQPAHGELDYETTLAQASGQPLVMPPRALTDVWHLLYTSGTTGQPKGVLQTYGMVFYNAVNISTRIDLTSADTTLNLLPCFHTGGLNMYANPTFHAGGTALIMRSFDPAETLKCLTQQATAFFGVPAIYLFLSQHPDFETTHFETMRSWACGGSPMPTALLTHYREWGINIRFGFGMTETGPTVFLQSPTSAAHKTGSVGQAVLHVDVKIVDRDGQPLPDGERGELLIRGPGVTPGYWNNPTATAAAFTKGWLHSGDVALCDADGDYFIVDRWKDMFISGGENVYPAEVENIIYQLPAVADVGVIGLPDDQWGEVGLAAIVLHPDQTLTVSAVRDYCRENLARYKVPKHIRFVTSLPRNAAGKVLKHELKASFGAET